MAAEGLSAGGSPSALPGWDLEAWYQDLEEVLAAAEPNGPAAPWGAEQQAELAQRWGAERAADGPEGCGLDAALAADLLELLEPARTAGAAPAGPPCSAPRLGSEDEAGAAAARAAKRKRCSAGVANKELAKRQERANEQRVLELTARNERLREDIRRLSAEVERTRAALIQRMVNLRRA